MKAHYVLAFFSIFFLSCSTTSYADNVVFDLNTGVSGQAVFAASELTHWDATQMQMPEVSPGHYQLSLAPPWTASFQYKYVVDGSWLADPSNSEQTDDGEGGVNSVMSVQFDEDPLLELQPGVQPWVQSTFNVVDSTGAQRVIIVMSPPPSFQGAGKRSVTIYFNDGTSYLQQGNAAQMIANLSYEPDMPVITGVFMDPRDRMTEYAENDPYVSFVADTVVPAVESRYSVGNTAADRLVIGSSLGGLISAYTALKRNDVFGNGASESGSFWWDNESILPVIAAAKGEKLRLYFDVGQYEEDIMLTSNHDARDSALQNGFDLEYQEFPSFHEFIGWRNRLSLIFRHFFAQ